MQDQATRFIIEFLERSQREIKSDMHTQMNSLKCEMNKKFESLEVRQRRDDKWTYMVYGIALVTWAAIEVGIKLLRV